MAVRCRGSPHLEKLRGYLGGFLYLREYDQPPQGDNRRQAAGRQLGSNLIASIGYPTGQTATFSYFANTGDHRLQEIENTGSNSAVISQFNYTYDAASRISTWIENNPSLSGTESYNLGYDGSDQLTTAQLSGTGGILKFYAYSYDSAENRLSGQANSAILSASVNDLNQLLSGTSGGPLLLSGTLQEPATVTINGNAATNPSLLSFSGTTAVTTGTNLVTIAATDPANQTTTHEYRVTVPASSGAYSYDANGNLTSDGVNTYQWDAANRLTAINETGSLSTQITYDGLGRRAQIVEKNNGTVTSTKNLLWCGTELSEERNASDTVTKRYYPQGVQISGTDYYYTRDHLGSIREVTGSTGILQARYDYDPYGVQTQLSGTMTVDFGYAGLYQHQPSGLYFGTYRPYSPTMDRWISRDPLAGAPPFLGLHPFRPRPYTGIAERTLGPNLYEYVFNDPVYGTDKLGLDEDEDDVADPYDDVTSDLECARKARVKACQNAMGKGRTTDPAPLTPLEIAGLEDNLEAATHTLANAVLGLNTQGNPISPETASLYIRLMEARIDTINQILASGMQAPCN